MKTHKTGTSTLVNILQRLGDTHNVSFLLPSDNQFLGWPCPFDVYVERIGLQCHHQYGILEHHAMLDASLMRRCLRDGAVLTTIVREPVAQARSVFGFYSWLSPGAGLLWDVHLTWLEGLTSVRPDDLSEDGRSGCHVGFGLRPQGHSPLFRNPQAYTLGWYARTNWSTRHDHDNAHIDAWLRDLDAELDLVLLTEAFLEGLVLLRRRLGCLLEEMRFVSMNTEWSGRVRRQGLQGSASAAARIPDLTREQHNRLLHVNNVDMRLHEHFTRVHRRAWAAPAWRARNSAEVLQLQGWNAELTSSTAPLAFQVSSLKYTAHLKSKQQHRKR